jgi:nucleoside-diphosphate-sugar epimerase
VSRTAALSGASGFLGARLAERLIEHGWTVRALVRRRADAERLAALGAETVCGDLADRAALEMLTAGALAAVNCAGLTKARTAAEFLTVNAEGAGGFAAAAPGQVIHVSSLAARAPELSPYAASKRAGEAAARAAAGERLAIIRPPVIYGPGDAATLGLFRMAARAPLAPTPARPAARLALAHVDDVATAIIDLMERGELTGVYAVGGARPAGYTWREIISAAFGAAGRRVPFAPLPASAIRIAGLASELAGSLCGQARIFTRGKAREMLHDDWSVGESELAPNAPAAKFSLETGFADALAWYRRAGWI